MAGIILLVSERSGSNLLRTMLGNHQDICAPVAPHFVTEFYRNLKYYGDLREEENVDSLYQDMRALANHPYHNWKLPEGEKGNIKSFWQCFDELYKQKAKLENKTMYCSKGIHSFNFIDEFRSGLPDVKFVHMVRDPRDHVASWLKSPQSKFTPYDIIQRWKEEQNTIMQAFKVKGFSCVSIRYEDLISDSEKEMSKVLHSLEMKIDSSCFSTNSSNEESKRNAYWKNLSKPLISDNKGKYHEFLNDDDILIVESIVKEEMEFFGYELESAANWSLDAKFIRENIRKSKKSKKEIDSKPIAGKDQLTDKRDFVKELIRKRKDVFYKQYPNQENIDKTSSIYVNSSPNFKGRIKLISLAVFGLNITNRIISLIK